MQPVVLIVDAAISLLAVLARADPRAETPLVEAVKPTRRVEGAEIVPRPHDHIPLVGPPAAAVVVVDRVGRHAASPELVRDRVVPDQHVALDRALRLRSEGVHFAAVAAPLPRRVLKPVRHDVVVASPAPG